MPKNICKRCGYYDSKKRTIYRGKVLRNFGWCRHPDAEEGSIVSEWHSCPYFIQMEESDGQDG